jgi:hypothetical protein
MKNTNRATEIPTFLSENLSHVGWYVNLHLRRNTRVDETADKDTHI